MLATRDDLLKQRAELETRAKQQSEEQSDIYQYLRNKLKDNYVAIAELETKVGRGARVVTTATSAYPFSLYLSVCVRFCLSVCPSACPPLSLCLSLWLSVSLSLPCSDFTRLKYGGREPLNSVFSRATYSLQVPGLSNLYLTKSKKKSASCRVARPRVDYPKSTTASSEFQQAITRSLHGTPNRIPPKHKQVSKAHDERLLREKQLLATIKDLDQERKGEKVRGTTV